MDSDGSLRTFADVQEAADDEVAGRAAIHEEQVMMLETSIRKAVALVDLSIQPHHVCDVVLAEVGEVGFWGVERVTCKSYRKSWWVFWEKSAISVSKIIAYKAVGKVSGQNYTKWMMFWLR